MSLSLKRVDPKDFPLPQFSNDTERSFIERMFFMLESLGCTYFISRRWAHVPYTPPSHYQSSDSESSDDNRYTGQSPRSDSLEDDVDLESLSRTVRKAQRTGTYTTRKSARQPKTYSVRTETQAHTSVSVVNRTHLSEEDVVSTHLSEEDVDIDRTNLPRPEQRGISTPARFGTPMPPSMSSNSSPSPFQGVRGTQPQLRPSMAQREASLDEPAELRDEDDGAPPWVAALVKQMDAQGAAIQRLENARTTHDNDGFTIDHHGADMRAGPRARNRDRDRERDRDRDRDRGYRGSARTPHRPRGRVTPSRGGNDQKDLADQVSQLKMIFEQFVSGHQSVEGRREAQSGLRESYISDKAISSILSTKYCLFREKGRTYTESEGSRKLRLIIWQHVTRHMKDAKYLYIELYIGDIRQLWHNIHTKGKPNASSTFNALMRQMMAHHKTVDICFPVWLDNLNALFTNMTQVGHTQPDLDKKSYLLDLISRDARYERVHEQILEHDEYSYNLACDKLYNRASKIPDLWDKQASRRKRESHSTDTRGGEDKKKDKKDEICEKHLTGECKYGKKCFRRHLDVAAIVSKHESNSSSTSPTPASNGDGKGGRGGRGGRGRGVGKGGRTSSSAPSKRPMINESAEVGGLTHPCFSMIEEGTCAFLNNEDNKCPYDHSPSTIEHYKKMLTLMGRRKPEGNMGEIVDHQDEEYYEYINDEGQRAIESNMAFGPPRTQFYSNPGVTTQLGKQFSSNTLGDGAYFNNWDTWFPPHQNACAPLFGNPKLVSMDTVEVPDADANREQEAKMASSLSATDRTVIPVQNPHTTTQLGKQFSSNSLGDGPMERKSRPENHDGTMPGLPRLAHEDQPQRDGVTPPMFHLKRTFHPGTRFMVNTAKRAPAMYQGRAITDSGTTHTFVNRLSMLVQSTIRRLKRTIDCGYNNGTSLPGTHVGTLMLQSNVPGCSEIISLEQSLFIPGSTRSLISIASLTDQGYYCDHGGGGVTIRRGPLGPNILCLPRCGELGSGLARAQHVAYPKTGVVTNYGVRPGNRANLYPIPDECFVQQPSRLPSAVGQYSSHAAARQDHLLDWRATVDIKLAEANNMSTKQSTNANIVDWHHVTHAPMAKLAMMERADTGRPLKSIDTNHPCNSCIFGKITAKSTLLTGVRWSVVHVGDHVSMDVSTDMGPSESGFRHYLLIVEWKTNFYTVFFLRTRAEADDYGAMWLRQFETKHRRKVGHVHIDGGELTSDRIKTVCRDLTHGITATTIHISAPYTHTHNSKAERGIGVIQPLERTIRKHGQAPKWSWPYSVSSAAHIHNLQPSTRDLEKWHPGSSHKRPLTPHEMWYDYVAPSYRYLLRNVHATFGYCVGHISKENKIMRPNKAADHAMEGIYLGKQHSNDHEQSAHIVKCFETGKNHIFNHVISVPGEFPCTYLQTGENLFEMKPKGKFDPNLQETTTDTSGVINLDEEDISYPDAPAQIFGPVQTKSLDDGAPPKSAAPTHASSLDGAPATHIKAITRHTAPVNNTGGSHGSSPDILEEGANTPISPVPFENLKKARKVRFKLNPTGPYGSSPWRESEDITHDSDTFRRKACEAIQEANRICKIPLPDMGLGTAVISSNHTTWINSDQGGVYKAKTSTVSHIDQAYQQWTRDLPHFEWQSVADHCEYTARLGSKSAVRGKGSYWEGSMQANVASILWGDHKRVYGDAFVPYKHSLRANSASTNPESLMYKEPPPDPPILPDPWSISADEVNRQLPKHYGQFHNTKFATHINYGMEAEIQKMCNWPIFGLPQCCPTGYTPIGTMWVISAKGDDEGTFVRIKGRLTLLGNMEKHMLSKAAAYAPVTHPETVRCELAIHIGDRLVRFWQIDVKQAYLTAMMERLVYCKHPPGFVLIDDNGRLNYRRLRPGEKPPNTVMRLLRALYGGMECGRLFWNKWVKWHLDNGFKTIHHDKCFLYKEWPDGSFIKQAFHVDDGAIAQKGDAMWKWYRETLVKTFAFSLGPLRKYVGLRFTFDYPNRICTIDQSHQVDRMLVAIKMDGPDSKRAPNSPVPSWSPPTASDIPTDPKEIAHFGRSFDMQLLVGHLLYIQCGTRPDISYALKILSKHTKAYGEKHIAWAKHLVRYLKHTQSQGLTYVGGNPCTLQIFTDASHGADVDTRRSLSGLVVKLGGNTVMWKCMYQSIVSHSSCESELMALDKGATISQYLKWLVEGMGAPTQNTIEIYCDNTGTIDISSNPIQPGRNLHVHARYFYVRDLFNAKRVVILHLRTARMIADVLCSYKGFPNFNTLAPIILNCAMVTKSPNGEYVWSSTRPTPKQ